MKTYRYIDKRINRDHNARFYLELADEFVQKAIGQRRNFSGWTMTYYHFLTTSHRKTSADVRIEVVMNFENNSIIITNTGADTR